MNEKRHVRRLVFPIMICLQGLFAMNFHNTAIAVTGGVIWVLGMILLFAVARDLEK